jgi:hypothetical protein
MSTIVSPASSFVSFPSGDKSIDEIQQKLKVLTIMLNHILILC